jgi:5-formyltetrahydrofolate cyclo-ligase
LDATGTARYEATKIPEAIKYPRGLSLSGPWSGAYGSHLTFVASEDFRQTATVVPSPPFPPGPRPEMPPLSKDVLRQTAIDARKAYVRTLSDAQRTRLEGVLAEMLRPLLANARVIGGYSPLGSEINPMRALAIAAERGATIAFPCFSHPSKPFRFRAGPCDLPGPFGLTQPPQDADEVVPDLVLVPLVAVDHRGTRLGRGKGHYDRALARLRKSGARLVGIGWPIQRLADTIPADDWDVPLDAFASPDGLELFNR